MTARYIIGDTRDVVASLPDGSVDLVLTSPPFLALRSYLPADHPDKWREIGSEATPAAFLDTLLELTAEWGRVLAPHGTLAVELGDSYSGGSAEGTDTRNERAGLPTKYAGRALGVATVKAGAGWPMAKSKALIPELYRIALAYGINPLTGQPSPAGRWRVRNVVTWCRPNPPVGALGDKFRPATSDMVIACRASDRWFDLDAVRGPAVEVEMTRVGAASASRGIAGGDSGNPDKLRPTANPAGAPPLDYWVIPPGGYTGAHFAVYPPELCRIPIEAMCPRQVCTVCGQPRRRIAETVNAVGHASLRSSWYNGADPRDSRRDAAHDVNKVAPDRAERVTLGWTDCGHDSWRPGIVLDPFGGSGTTGLVATGLGRDAILIDIDDRNADLARDRIGMFLEVEDRRPVLSEPAQ